MHPSLRPLVVSLALSATAACGDDGGSGGSGGGGSGGGGGQGGGGGASGDLCGSVESVFPTFDQSCTVDGDCALKFHMIDCCGSMVAIGVSTSESAAFDAAEATCQSQYPACGCDAQPTQADDGNVVTDPSLVHVTCSTDGACRTSV